MGIPKHVADEMARRCAVNSQRRVKKPDAEFEEERDEIGRGGIHDKIIEYCEKQWPKWMYIRHRTDKKSGIQQGAPDFVIALPNGMTLWLECKAKGKKLTNHQLGWKVMLDQLQQKYALVHSFEEFQSVCKTLL